jgi:hypothetical protein
LAPRIEPARVVQGAALVIQALRLIDTGALDGSADAVGGA